MSFQTSVEGPLYDGQAAAAVDDFLEETTRVVAEMAETEIQTTLGSVLKHPTGHYRSRVVADRATDDAWRVHDSGVVYGPWLEGTSDRNRASRFKGYATFRRVFQWLDGKAGDVADDRLPRHLERMGGDR